MIRAYLRQSISESEAAEELFSVMKDENIAIPLPDENHPYISHNPFIHLTFLNEIIIEVAT